MREITGQLVRLGAGTLNAQHSYYSVIQIGNISIPRVLVSNHIAAFLDLGETVTLYVRRYFLFNHILLGVRHQSGVGSSLHSIWFIFLLLAKLVTYPIMLAVLLWGPWYIYTYLHILIPNLPMPVFYGIAMLLLVDFIWFLYDFMRVKSAIR